MSALNDLTGQVFSRLTVLHRDGSTNLGQARWLCRCECGRTVSVVGSALRRHTTKSCRRHAKYERQSEPLADRFWRKVQKTDTCWLWTAGTFKRSGYGQFDQQRAHRIAWTLTYGPIPLGLNVCHRCDNPRCVRPDHLFLGTQTDNHRDMCAKGRIARGEGNAKARFTADDVREIRRLRFEERLSWRVLARRFPSVHPSTVRCAAIGETWKHI